MNSITMKNEEDTMATESDDDSQYSYEANRKMPPLKYARIVGCLPRQSDSSPIGTEVSSRTTSPMEEEISCSTLGILTSIPSSSCISNYSIVATGYDNGSIRLMDTKGESVLFGSTLKDGGVWYIHPKKRSRVVDIAFDSGCGSLAAVNQDGDVVIFGPLLWGDRDEHHGNKQSLLSLMGQTSTNDDACVEKPGRQLSQVVLSKPPMNTVRFSYEQSPTCMMLDPSYSRDKKEKSILLGFKDGRLILSKFQTPTTSGLTSFFGGSGVKKFDTTIYQGMNPIESLAWRGSLIAWADESGVRIFDIETMSRIAHVDRPTGARSNLYPTIGMLRPCVLFERADRLLIGWGDCLMGMKISDATKQGKDGLAKKKIVECVMAWQLDCVACGVVPFDSKHVAVLGLVPCSSDPEDDDNYRDEEYFAGLPGCCVAGGNNMLELQIINREDGKSVSNDRVPLLDKSTKVKPNAADFALLSSYATQHMEDLAEWDALDDGEKENIRNEIDMREFMTNQTFPDAHLRWNMEKDVCTIDFGNGIVIPNEISEDDEQSTSSDHSVLSDDYVFVLSEPIQDILSDPGMPLKAYPPSMIIMYKYDVCLVQTRDCDDAISYARSLGKPALALKAALAHRRDVRRHGIDLLVDEYFVSLLRMNSGSAALSFPRLQIAAQSVPILLGGDSRMWQRWIFMFARLCGGLHLIRDKIPVRDPWLPPFVFEMALEKMLQETCSEEQGQSIIKGTMSDLFIETLRSWGPTSSLRQRIQLHRYFINSHSIGPKWRSVSDAMASFVQKAERDLRRRITQTAFGVLEDTESDGSLMHPPLHQHVSSSDDSLFSVENMIMKYTQSLVKETHAVDFASSTVQLCNLGPNTAIVLESLAELELMSERYDRALGYYLAIGSSFMEESLLLSIEDAAVKSVNSSHQNDNTTLADEVSQETAGLIKFGHVLSLVELHQLHQLLLSRNYFFTDIKDESKVCSPIISLIKLVGLDQAGTFLMESCSPPDDSTSDRTVFASLPLDLVADQLKSKPKLLYWYLYLLFVQKPDMYVNFATTAVPPVVITDLHRTQFFLFVDYADLKDPDEKDNAPSFLDVDKDTPFMAFLAAALPHGGIRHDRVIETLEKHRGQIDSPIYAQELAFVMEKFGNGGFDNARKVLDIYLLGAKNLFLAVAYTERNSEHSGALWEILIAHSTEAAGHGALFGSLLEAAAHCGADLSSLVAKIPEGVQIEGLRTKLIAAVTDYRYKVKIHEFESTILTNDKISIIRAIIHRSRRGSRRQSSIDRLHVSVGRSDQTTMQSKQSLHLQREKMSHLSSPSHMSNSCSLSIR